MHPWFSQDKKDFIEKRVKRLLKAGIISALAVMVKADNSILTDQTKEMLARWERKHLVTVRKKTVNDMMSHMTSVFHCRYEGMQQ